MADSVSFRNYSGGLQNHSVSKERGIGCSACMVLEYFSGVMQMEVSPDPLPRFSARWLEYKAESVNASNIL